MFQFSFASVLFVFVTGFPVSGPQIQHAGTQSAETKPAITTPLDDLQQIYERQASTAAEEFELRLSALKMHGEKHLPFAVDASTALFIAERQLAPEVAKRAWMHRTRLLLAVAELNLHKKQWSESSVTTLTAELERIKASNL